MAAPDEKHGREGLPPKEPELARVDALDTLRQADCFFLCAVRVKTPAECLEHPEDESPLHTAIIQGGDGNLLPVILSELGHGLHIIGDNLQAVMNADEREIQRLQEKLGE